MSGHWSEGAFVKAMRCLKREKIQVCAHSEEKEKEGNKQKTPKHCLGKCVLFQRSLRLCRGSESPFYLPKFPAGTALSSLLSVFCFDDAARPSTHSRPFLGCRDSCFPAAPAACCVFREEMIPFF